MAVAAGLGITPGAGANGFFIRGKIPDEKANPINRLLIRLYEPLLDKVLTFPENDAGTGMSAADRHALAAEPPGKRIYAAAG